MLILSEVTCVAWPGILSQPLFSASLPTILLGVTLGCMALRGAAWCYMVLIGTIIIFVQDSSVDWTGASMAFHLSLDGDYNTAELL